MSDPAVSETTCVTAGGGSNDCRIVSIPAESNTMWTSAAADWRGEARGDDAAGGGGGGAGGAARENLDG